MTIDTQQNERMWIAFVRLTKWSVALISIVVILMALALL